MSRGPRNYHGGMSVPRAERPDLPESMTWEELERLPEEIAEQIELWNGSRLQMSISKRLKREVAPAARRTADLGTP